MFNGEKKSRIKRGGERERERERIRKMLTENNIKEEKRKRKKAKQKRNIMIEFQRIIVGRFSLNTNILSRI